MVDQVAKSLWTPEGNRPLRERDVIPLNSTEVRMLSWLHQWAEKFQLSIICKRCDHSIHGRNNDDPSIRHVTVSCQCREWRYHR